MVGKVQKLARTSQQRGFVRTNCEQEVFEKVTAIGFKRAENSRGNFFKCSTGCDVREKNYFSRIINSCGLNLQVSVGLHLGEAIF